jgi:uncharacterized membrane protein
VSSTPFVPAGRIVGLDVARALALLGMMATHILVGIENGQLTTSQELAGGRASALFAVLAGVSLALMTGRSTPPRGRAWAAAAAGIAARAVVIALVGLLLGEVDSGIAVILTYYGVLFLLGTAFLGLRAPALAGLAAVWLVAAPVVSQLLRPELPPRQFESPSFDMLATPWQLLTELTFTGYYPAVPWLAYLLAGMAIGRMDLRRWRTVLGILLTGGATAVASTWLSARLLERPGVMDTLDRTFTGPGGQPTLELTLDHGLYGSTPTGSWWWLAVDAPHTATPFDLAHTIGSSLLVIGVCLAVVMLVPRVLPSVLAVVFGAGAMTLTLYSLHVFSRSPDVWDGSSTGTYVAQVVLVLGIGALYRLLGRSGPLERAVTAAGTVVRRAVGGPDQEEGTTPRRDDDRVDSDT